MLALYRLIALYILMVSSAMGAGRSQYYCRSGGEITTLRQRVKRSPYESRI